MRCGKSVRAFYAMKYVVIKESLIDPFEEEVERW